MPGWRLLAGARRLNPRKPAPNLSNPTGFMPEFAAPLTDFLREHIARRGPIPFRDFMAAALYHPEGGYYGSGRARIGKEGDFFTNVSVGALFGKLLARQFAEMWERLGRPAVFTVVEQGANRGEFARDALGGLREFALECSAAISYWIIEPIPALRKEQAAMLAGFERVRWAESLETLPRFTGAHFSNELVDALPVHRVLRTGGRWMEQYVDFQEERFVFVSGAVSSTALEARLALLPAVPDGYQTEINLAALDWIAALAGRLERGFVLAIDYGFSREEYYRPERTDGTLSAYAGHRREADPLARPGEIDLTAHVDFTSLVERAEENGLGLLGFTDQHHFMVGLGKSHFAGGSADPREVGAFKTLMHPNLMGRSFKILCLEKGARQEKAPAGFEFARPPRAALWTH
jgi:SAM-dependent MidA family methyltransferase